MGVESVTGLDELLKKLKELKAKVANEIVDRALAAGAEPMLATAKALVPVDTGLLRESLKIIAKPPRRNKHLVQVSTEEGAFKGETFYGAFIEYGYRRGKRTRRKGSDKRQDSRPEVPARPYMRPAFDQNVHQSIEIISREIGAGIERAAKS